MLITATAYEIEYVAAGDALKKLGDDYARTCICAGQPIYECEEPSEPLRLARARLICARTVLDREERHSRYVPPADSLSRCDGIGRWGHGGCGPMGDGRTNDSGQGR